MSQSLHTTFLKRPSTIAYMARAFVPSPGLKRTRRFPPIRLVWKNVRVGRQELSSFLRLTGLRLGQGMPLLFPHVFGFRLQMALLTHTAFPMPIWGALQIRNHLLQHRPIFADDSLELETRVAGQRILEKGAEVDLYTAVRSEDELAWESLTTFLPGPVRRTGRPFPAGPSARDHRRGGCSLAGNRRIGLAFRWPHGRFQRHPLVELVRPRFRLPPCISSPTAGARPVSGPPPGDRDRTDTTPRCMAERAGLLRFRRGPARDHRARRNHLRAVPGRRRPPRNHRSMERGNRRQPADRRGRRAGPFAFRLSRRSGVASLLDERLASGVRSSYSAARIPWFGAGGDCPRGRWTRTSRCTVLQAPDSRRVSDTGHGP